MRKLIWTWKNSIPDISPQLGLEPPTFRTRRPRQGEIVFQNFDSQIDNCNILLHSTTPLVMCCNYHNSVDLWSNWANKAVCSRIVSQCSITAHTHTQTGQKSECCTKSLPHAAIGKKCWIDLQNFLSTRTCTNKIYDKLRLDQLCLHPLSVFTPFGC